MRRARGARFAVKRRSDSNAVEPPKRMQRRVSPGEGDRDGNGVDFQQVTNFGAAAQRTLRPPSTSRTLRIGPADPSVVPGHVAAPRAAPARFGCF